MNNYDILKRTADNIRILSASMVEKAKSGHPGGAMGGADFVSVLFAKYLNFDPQNPRWENRDRFFLDPGHMSPMLYSILAMIGKFDMDDLKNFRQWGSKTPGHPEVDLARAIENTSGPLGQGHVMAVGAAIAERFLAARFGEWTAHKTYAFISDGGIQEEISQGAGRIAGHLGLNNLIMFFDSNDVQLSHNVDAVTSENTAAKYESWGWNVKTINGNCPSEIIEALDFAVASTAKPTLIIGKTIMGKGAVNESNESFEGYYSTHGQPLSAAGASFSKTIENLGGDSAEPFQIFDDVKDYFEQVLKSKSEYAAKKQAEQKAWEAENPGLATKFRKFYSGELNDFDFSKIQHKPNLATRASSGNVLEYLAQNVDNMIVSSADLSNSDKTDSFLKHTKPLMKGDFSGAFLHAGVAELTMAAIANGMALHGGVIAAVATFFVFSDYMKPAIRMAALMELPVKYIWTHDSFRVGEDGPTHQPIEQEAQLRLMEKLYNHSGKRSMLVLRPADSAETTVAWKMAMENTSSPTGLILSRQNVTDLPFAQDSTRFQEAQAATKGAYVIANVHEEVDITLVANGSEVSTLVEACMILKGKGVGAKVVSAISEGLYMDQSAQYREATINPNKPSYGLTAGLPVTLQPMMTSNSKVQGLDHFGFSAPANILDEKFGFNPNFVAMEILKFLGKY